MIAGYIVDIQDLSALILSTKSSGIIGVAVYNIDSLSLPPRGMMSFLIVDNIFSTYSAFSAVSLVCRSSNITIVGLSVPCFKPLIPPVIPLTDITLSDVFDPFIFGSIKVDDVLDRDVESPL